MAKSSKANASGANAARTIAAKHNASLPNKHTVTQSLLRTKGIAAGRRVSQDSKAQVALMLELFGREPNAKTYELGSDAFKAGYIADQLGLNDEDRAFKILKLEASKRSKVEQSAYKAAGMALSRAIKRAGVKNPSAKAGNGNATRGTKAVQTAASVQVADKVATDIAKNVKSIADIDRVFRNAVSTMHMLVDKHGKLSGMTEYRNALMAIQEIVKAIPKIED